MAVTPPCEPHTVRLLSMRPAALLALLEFLVVTLTHTSASPETTKSTLDRLANVTQTISRLLDGYDIRLRPNFGGEPLYVGMDLTIASFDSISEVNMNQEVPTVLAATGASPTPSVDQRAFWGLCGHCCGILQHSGGYSLQDHLQMSRNVLGKVDEFVGDYTITMYLNQYWKDERLAFSNNDEVLTLSGDFAEKIWVPDTFFANDKNSFLHDVTERNKLVRLNGDGSITYGMRFTTTLACMMDLHYYPLDSQNCTVEIESYGYTVTDVVMYWRDTPVRGVEEAELPQFTIIGYGTNDRIEKLATGAYQRLSLSFKLKRNIGYFVFQTYLPSILIVMLSWVSFWINHEATSARVALGITTVLTMTTISTGVRSSLPRISYVKAIDIYLVMCFVFVFAALLEYAAVNYTYWGARAKKKSKKNKEAEETTRKQSIAGTKVVGSSVSDGYAGGSTGDEIIELQDIRLSPIPSIRNRHNSGRFSTSSGMVLDDPAKFPPSFRMSRSGYTFPTSRPGLRLRHPRATARPRLLHAFKRGASVIKASMPKIKDVNIIDKYSRVVFPVSFLMFNLGYWVFYVV